MTRGEFAPLSSRPEDMRILELMMAALWGFLIAGLFADRFVYAMEVIGAGVALGSIVANAAWLAHYRDRDYPRVIGFGGLCGAGFGTIVLLIDALIGA